MPSGRNVGNRWLNSLRAGSMVVAGSTLPPFAGTLYKEPPASGAKTITFEVPHEPPRPLGASARVSARPPAAEIVFNLFRVKNPIRRLSGDQNGRRPSSASSSRLAVNESSERTHRWVSERATTPTTNAPIAPSADNATAPESGYRRSPLGGRIDNRDTPAGAAPPRGAPAVEGTTPRTDAGPRDAPHC